MMTALLSRAHLKHVMIWFANLPNVKRYHSNLSLRMAIDLKVTFLERNIRVLFYVQTK